MEDEDVQTGGEFNNKLNTIIINIINTTMMMMIIETIKAILSSWKMSRVRMTRRRVPKNEAGK